MASPSFFLLVALAVSPGEAGRFRSHVTLRHGQEGGRARRDAPPVSHQLEDLEDLAKFRLYWPEDADSIATDCHGDNDCCTLERPCAEGEGDCEPGYGQCAVGLKCVENNCQALHQDEEDHDGFSSTDDCCVPRDPCDGTGKEDGCCSYYSPCILGEGTCSSDDDCASDLVCGECYSRRFSQGDKCCVLRCSNLENLAPEERRGIPCR